MPSTKLSSDCTLNRTGLRSAQDRGELGQYFIENRGRDTFNLAAIARPNIDCARLITAYDAGCASARICQGDRETRSTGKVPASRYR